MLQIERQDLGKSTLKITVKIPSDLMRGYFSRTYNALAPQVEVKGFRKGMAPKALTISAIGENRLAQEIIDIALQETYIAALKQENITPISAPKVNIKMLKDLMVDSAELEYEAEIAIMPEVKLGDYKKIKTKKPEKIDVKKEEIEQVLSHLQRQHADFREIDRATIKGDRVEIDFVGTERGVILENLSSKNYPIIIGSGVIVPEFEENLVGLKKGDEKEFDLMMGQGGANSEKKKVHFKVNVLDTKEVILPDLDDMFAQKFQKPTIAELMLAVSEDVSKQKELAQKQSREAEAIEALAKMAKVEIPEILIDQETHRMIDELKSRSQMMNMPFEQYLAQLKKTEEDLHKDFHEQAEKTVRIGLALGEVAKKEKMDIKDKEVGKKVVEKLLEYAQK